MTGRPSSFTAEIADAICERLADGESMRSICRDEAMPARSTVDGWLAVSDEFRAKCARAREWQADGCDDEIVTLMSQVRAGEVLAPEARVLLAGLQWRASKLAPKRYGDKTLLTGPDGESAPKVDINVRFG